MILHLTYKEFKYNPTIEIVGYFYLVHFSQLRTEKEKTSKNKASSGG